MHVKAPHSAMTFLNESSGQLLADCSLPHPSKLSAGRAVLWVAGVAALLGWSPRIGTQGELRRRADRRRHPAGSCRCPSTISASALGYRI